MAAWPLNDLDPIDLGTVLHGGELDRDLASTVRRSSKLLHGGFVTTLLGFPNGFFLTPFVNNGTLVLVRGEVLLANRRAGKIRRVF